MLSDVYILVSVTRLAQRQVLNLNYSGAEINNLASRGDAVTG